MKTKNTVLLSIIIVCAFITSCKSKDEDFASQVPSYKQYLPEQAGTVTLYRLDSTVPTSFGTQLVVHSYIAKDSVAGQKLDATGDTTFEIYRFITDTLQTKPWALCTVYQIVYTKNTADLIQANGLRFIKLSTPVIAGNSWNGNQYFISGNASSSDDPDYAYEGWNYSYDSVGLPYQTSLKSFDNAVIVNEANSVLGNTGAFDPTLYQEVKYSQEVYAQNEGLIFQNTLYYSYQPAYVTLGAGYDPASFGIKLTRIQ